MIDAASIILQISLIILILSIVIILFSLARFKSIYIKMVAMEVLSNTFISGIAFWSLISGEQVFIDICIPLSLMIYLSTVGYCQFLSKE